jgi:hypothetical protein
MLKRNAVFSLVESTPFCFGVQSAKLGVIDSVIYKTATFSSTPAHPGYPG